MKSTRTRFAPSPTGFLHVGGLRTALYNYLFSKQSKGKTLLRIEDTDQSRIVEGSIDNIISSFQWLSMNFDESPLNEGDFGPYLQSERFDLYQKHAAILLEQGNAYHCFCSTDQLDSLRKAQQKKGLPPRYDGRCRRLSQEETQAKLAEKIPSVIRMKIRYTSGDFVVDDLVKGKVVFKPQQIDDQVLIKSDGFPTYHLANVIDDHFMQISHVIRGEEWLPSTPKHIQLYQFFGWEMPKFAHLPLLLNPDKSKLSKRQNDVAVEDYMNKGYLKEAMINFIALLGWHEGSDKEFYTIDELIEKFSFERVSKSASVFDVQKLDWMNQHYIQEKSDLELFELTKPFFNSEAQTLEKETLLKIIALVKKSMQKLSDFNTAFDLTFSEQIQLDKTDLQSIEADQAKTLYQTVVTVFEQANNWDQHIFSELCKKLQQDLNIKGKFFWKPMRLGITHKLHGPELPLIAEIFGKEKTTQRLKQIIQHL